MSYESTPTLDSAVWVKFGEANSSQDNDVLHEAILDNDERKTESLLRDHGVHPSAKDDDGHTPLHHAIQLQNERIVRLLLGARANPRTRDKNGYSPLHLAARLGDLEIIKLLVHEGADLAAVDNRGKTPLHTSVRSGKLACVYLLLDLGANPMDEDEHGKTPLHGAAWKGQAEVLERLVEKGGDPSVKDEFGWVPLHFAAQNGREKCVTFLVKKSDPSAPNSKGLTPLHYAAWKGHLKIMELLVEHGAKMNACDKDGKSPFHYAAWNGRVECVKFFLEKKVKANGEDSNGMTPLLLAMDDSQKECAKLLMEASPRTSGFKIAEKYCVSYLEKLRESGDFPFMGNEEMDRVLFRIAIAALASGNLTITRSQKITDILLGSLPWEGIAPFLLSVSVEGNYITSLPVGLSYLNPENTRQIDFFPDAGWRTLERFYATLMPDRIVAFSKAKREGGTVPMKAMRLMVMGGPAVGKTSMIRRLRDEGDGIPLSTDGVELGEIELEGDMVLETWDFGGQKIYRITHQLFLCDSCLYVVMFRLSDSLVLSEQEIKFWIDSALSRTKKVTVLLIGTHADRLPEGVGEKRLAELHEKMTEHYGSKRIYQEPGMMWASEDDMKKTFLDNFVKRKDAAADKMKKLLVQATRSLMVRVPAPLEVVRVALAELKREVGPITKLGVVQKMLREVAHRHNLDSLKNNEATGLEYLEILDRLGYILVVRPSKHTEEISSSSSSNSPRTRHRFGSFSSSSSRKTPPSFSSSIPLSSFPETSYLPRERSHSYSGVAAPLLNTEEDKEEKDVIAIILEPQWIMKLLATLISTKTTFSTKGGVMKHSHLTNHLWTNHKLFPPKYHNDMVNLLIQLNIMYPFPNRESELSYFVPCLLEEEQPDVQHGLTSVFLNYGMEESFYLERSIQMKKKRPVPIAVLPMVIIQLMQIGEVVECWQQGCAVVLFSPKGKVECRCILRRSTPQKIEVWMDAGSLSLGGKWMKKVTRCLENMLEEFYHVDYSIDVLYRGSGRSASCNPCVFSLDDIVYAIAQKKAGMYCKKLLHGILLQHLVPDLLLHEASSSNFIPRNSLSLVKEIGRGSFGKVLLCTLGDSKRISLSVPDSIIPSSITSSSSLDCLRVAVKVLEVEASEAMKEKMIEIQKEFYLEVYTMGGLDHPNIVRLLGISDFHNPAIVLELVEGGGLLEQINSMNIPLNEKYGEIIEFIGGYRSAISLGQIHDPLPSQELLCNGAVVKIEKLFEKWLGIAKNTHEKSILDLQKESREVLDAVYSCTLTAKKQGEIHDALVEKTTNLLRETSLIYAPIPWILRLKITLEIAMGLAYLHTLTPPIIHRDLKSPNIFLTTGLAQLEITDELLAKPLAKIGDFGWSVQLHGVTTHTLRGGHKSKIGLLNPMWASPEVLQEFQSYSTKADIYSLGIIMWEILVRKIPFSDDLTNLSFALRGYIIGGGRPSIPKELRRTQEKENPELFQDYASLMEECWHQEPSCRPTALLLCQKLKNLIERHDPRLYKVMGLEEKIAALMKAKKGKEEREGEKEVKKGKGGESTKSAVASSFTFHSLLWRNVSKTEQTEDQIKKLDLNPTKVTYAALDWVWIGFQSGILAALQPRICDRLILCHPQNAHSEGVSALCFQSLGGRVWSGSCDGSINVWKADPQSRNEVLEHLQLKGWLRRVNLVFDEDLWVCVENGLLRTFKDRYFGTQSECVPITSDTLITVGKSRTSFTVQNPDSTLDLKFTAPSSTKNKQSPPVEEWITILQQLQRSQTISNSLVLLAKTGMKKTQTKIGEGGIWSMEAVGRSVWCRQKIGVTEFSLKMETDEHGLHRSARIEPGRVIKIPTDTIPNLQLNNQIATELASFDVRHLCVAVGNAVAVVPCDQDSLIWSQEKDRSPSSILCIASVWNNGGKGRGGPEVWSFNGQSIQIWGFEKNQLGLIATLPVPSDISLSCLAQIGPNEVWAGTKWEELEGPEWKKGGMVIGWNISSRQPLSIPLQYEQEGNVTSLATFSKSLVTPKERKWVAFAVSDDEALSRFVFWT